jgi:hypothetical protein
MPPPPPSIETTKATMKDVLPLVRSNYVTVDKDYGMLPIQNASDYCENKTSSGSVFDAICQYSVATKILLRHVRHKHTKGCWINAGFRERVPSWLEVKLVDDGSYTMDIFVKPEDGVLIETPIPFAFPDTTGNIVEGPMLTPHQEDIDLSMDDELTTELKPKGMETDRETRENENENVSKYAAALFRDSNVMAFPHDLSSDEEEDGKPAAQSRLQCAIAMPHLDAAALKEVITKDEDAAPPIKPSSEQKCHMTLEGMWSSKYSGTQKMLEVFLASKGFTPVAPLAPTQLFTVSSLAQSNPKSPNAIDFIATVPSPLDSTPRNVYRFDSAANHRPMAGLTRFSDEKK